MIIAQRFNVGFSHTKANKSRRDGRHPPPTQPSLLVTLGALLPNVETLGYCRISLRDKHLAGGAPLSSASNVSGIGLEIRDTVPIRNREKPALRLPVSDPREISGLGAS